MKVLAIKPHLVSSDYGANASFGQPLGVKTIGIVEIHLDNGVIGYGESYSAIYMPDLFCSTVESLCPLLVGRQFSSPLDIFRDFFIPFCSRNGFIASVFSAIDIALWDSFLQSTNQTLSGYLGVTPRIDQLFYFSGGSVAFSPHDIMAEAKALPDFFDGYKIRVGRQPWETDILRMRTAKTHWHKSLMIDSIMGTLRPSLTSGDWLPRLDVLNDLSVYWLEEPFSPNDYTSYFDPKCLLKSIPIAYGEAITGVIELLYFCKSPNISFLQLDATHVGGISLILDNLDAIIESGKDIAFHVWGSPLSFAANLHLSSVFPKISWVEYPGTPLSVFNNSDPQFFMPDLDLRSYLSYARLSSPKLKSVINASTYVPGSGYTLPS